MNKKTIFILLLQLGLISTLYAQSTFQKTYGGAGYNQGIDILPINNNSTVVLGNRSGFNGATDIYLLMIDSTGKIKWDKAFGTAATEIAETFIGTNDNGFLIIGTSNDNLQNDYNILLIKTDSLGNHKWTKTYGGTDWDFGYSLIQLPDNGFLIAGNTFSYGSGDGDIILIKTNSNGDTLWTNVFGSNFYEELSQVFISLDGQYLITGNKKDTITNQWDGFYMKVDTTGTLIWQKSYGDINDDKFYGGFQMPDSSFILYGYTKSFNAIGKDALILNANQNGDTIWKQLHGGAKDEEFKNGFLKKNGNLAFAGYTTSFGNGGDDFYTIITASSGYYLSGNTFGKIDNERCRKLSPSLENGYFFCGTTNSYGIAITNIFVIKTDSVFYANPLSYSHEVGLMFLKPSEKEIKIFPNPARDKLSISKIKPSIPFSLKIYDINGKSIFSEESEHYFENQLHTIETGNFKSGIYFLIIRQSEFIYSEKIIIIK